MWNTNKPVKRVTSRLAGKKKINLLLFALLAASGMHAQKLDLCVMGSYQSTWLFNQNISDLGKDQDYAAGWGYNYGLGASIYFTKKIGIEVDGLLNLHTGAYAGELDSGITYTSNVKLNSINIPLLFKLRGETGAYFEVGPQLGMISGATFNFKESYYNSGTGQNVNNDTSFSVTSHYGSMNISAVIGFGVKIKFGDHLSLRSGLRLEWGLADLKGVDALSNRLDDLIRYPTARATNSASGGLLIGLTWSFGNTDSDSGPKPPPPPPTGN